MNILIVKPSSLGDVVQALPVLRLLRRRFPTAAIDWWLARSLAPLLEDDPDLRAIIPFDRFGWGTRRRWSEFVQTILQARRRKYDWVIDLQGLARSGLFAWAVRGRFLIGVEDPREKAFALYDLSVPRPSAQTHAVDWYLEVLRRLNVPIENDWEWLPPKREVQRQLEKRWPAPSPCVWIALVPGARWPTKRWPAANFARLASCVSNVRPDCRFVIIGGQDDREAAATIAAAVPHRCVDTTGQTSLPEMVEWVRRSSLVIANDTAPLHVAAALDVPVVALFGPTDPKRTGPYGRRASVLQHPLPCAPCLRERCAHRPELECLTGITPEAVAKEALRRLDRGSMV